MDWMRGIKFASVVVGLPIAGTAVVVGLIYLFGGWALIPVVAILFGVMAWLEAAR